MLESFLEMGARVVTTTSEARKSQGEFEDLEGFRMFQTFRRQDLAGGDIYSRIFLCALLFWLLCCCGRVVHSFLSARREQEQWPFLVLISTIRHSNQLKDWAFQAGNARKKCGELLIQFMMQSNNAVVTKFAIFTAASICIHDSTRLGSKEMLYAGDDFKSLLSMPWKKAGKQTTDDHKSGYIYIYIHTKYITAAQCLASNLN